MNAEIISIGTELLLGEINDTNATYIAQQLKDIGLNLFFRTTVGDNEQRITDVIKLAMSRANIIITTGGLGPTVDDMTRQGIANAVEQPLEIRQALVDEIIDKFKRFNSKMTDNNKAQAFLPRDAIAINNPVGTAPGFIVQFGELGAIISLPGVPREMKYLMEHSVIPYIQGRTGASIIKLRVLRTAGAGESWLGEQITDLMKQENPTVGTAAHSGQTDIRITAKAATEAEADSLIATMEAEVRRRVGAFIYGVDKEPMENALIGTLREMDARIAISETGTGGLLRQRMREHAHGADAIAAAEQFDSLAELRAHLGLDGAAALQTMAQTAAQHLLANSGAEIALSVVSDQTGTVIDVWNGVEMRDRSYAYGGVDVGGPEWASAWGISMAWRLLSDMKGKTEQAL